MSYPIKLIFDLVLVEKEEDEQTKSGLFVPRGNNAVVGKVKAIGPGQRSTSTGEYFTPKIKPGDRVYVNSFDVPTVKYKDDEMYLFREEDIFGIIRGNNMEFPIEPLFDYIFVKKDSERMSKGLHLPQSVKGRATTGKVVAVGPGLRSPEDGHYLTPCVKPGDTVYVKEFSGYIIRYEGQEVHLFREGEIVGVLNESN